jgi:hypothetical protein
MPVNYMFEVKDNGDVFLIAKVKIQIGLNEWRDIFYSTPLRVYERVRNDIPSLYNLAEYFVYKDRFEEAYKWYSEVNRVHIEDDMGLDVGLYEL